MAECPFCFTELDERATVCKGCKAQRGYGNHSTLGFMTAGVVRSRVSRYNTYAVLWSLVSVGLIYAWLGAGVKEAALPLFVTVVVAVVLFVTARSWNARLQKPPTWWK